MAAPVPPGSGPPAPRGGPPEKRALRRRMRAWRRDRSPAETAAASARIRRRLAGLAPLQQAHTVLLFAAMPGEVDLAGLAVPRPCWPVVVGRGQPLRLRGAGPRAPGPFGISEPTAACPEIDPAEVDVVIVPGLAFDTAGGRLGMGGGFYDRTLAGMRALRIGVGFASQRVAAVPREPHDLPLDWLVCDDGLWHPGR